MSPPKIHSGLLAGVVLAFVLLPIGVFFVDDPFSIGVFGLGLLVWAVSRKAISTRE